MANKTNHQPEEVQATGTELFIQNNGKKVLYVAAAFICILAVVLGIKQCNSSNDIKASHSEALIQAQFDFEAQQYEAALAGFESVISEFGSTKSGNLAKAYAGLCQKKLGNLAEAISYLKQYDGNDQVIAPAIYAALGDCYVDSETPDYDAAAKAFEKAAAAANNTEFSPLYLRKAGLVYEAKGENGKALKAYEAIKNNWPNSELASSIDKYISRVK
ncbi:MAG: tetratricopeptide repeat protein [Bacteroidales bacterium]|nr:tetratricopeptide repeat protein [Candidatus Liminaster caballi]